MAHSVVVLAVGVVKLNVQIANNPNFKYEVRYNPAMVGKEKGLEASVMLFGNGVLDEDEFMGCSALSGQLLGFCGSESAADSLTRIMLFKARSDKSSRLISKVLHV